MTLAGARTYALDSNGGIDDHSLPRFLHPDPLLGLSILLGNEGADVGLDATSPESDNDHSRDQTTQRCTMFDGRWEGGTEQDEQSEHVDDGEVQYRVVPSQVLVCDNSP